MGGSEHDGGSVVPPMQAPQGSHVTGRLPYDWSFRPQEGPERERPQKALRGPERDTEPLKTERRRGAG